MAEPQDSARQDIQRQASSFLASLRDEEKMLIVLCRQLYQGQWDDMLQDLRDRLEGKPHVFEWGPLSPRLKTTIGEHIDIIHRLRKFEQEHKVSLAELIDEKGQEQ